MTAPLVSLAEIDRLKAAHPTDTRALVREVANRLFVAGERPTRALVRELIGRGSMTTIDAGLREWWDGLRNQLDTRIDVPGIPEALVPAFQTALASLWQQAAVEAKATFDDERGQAQAQIQDARAGEAAAHAMVDSLQTSLDATRAELAERDRRLVKLDHELETAKTSLAAATTALQQETAAREADRRQAEAHQQAQESAMAQVLAERTREREALEGQLAFATRQIDEAREKSKALASDVQRERGRAERAEEATRATTRELADERRARDAERAALVAEKAEQARRHEVVSEGLREDLTRANACTQETAVENARLHSTLDAKAREIALLRQALETETVRAKNAEQQLAAEREKQMAAAMIEATSSTPPRNST